MGNATCSVEGCERDSWARSWCSSHYKRWRKYGSPLAGRIGSYDPDVSCSAEGCAERPKAAGYCASHYHSWKRYGDPLLRVQNSPYGPDETCAIDGCGDRPEIKGYCRRHGSHLYEYGSPLARKERGLDDLLRETGWTVTPSGCWEWNGKRNDNGYGLFYASHLGFRGARAHRAMYEHLVAPIADGLELRHHCDNPPCVNPEHLEPGTHAANMADMTERGRRWDQTRTHCLNGHDLRIPGATRKVERKKRGEDISETICVECARKRARDYMRRRRAA